MEIVFYLLPCIVSAIFTALLLSRRHKTLAERFMSQLMCECALFFMFDAYVVYQYSYPEFKVMAYMTNALLVPLIPTSVCIIAWSLHTIQQHYPKWVLLANAVPVFLFTVEIFNYTGLGFDKAAEFYANGRTMPAGLDSWHRHMYQMFEYIAIDVYNIISSIALIASIVFLCYVIWNSDLSFSVIYRFLFKHGPLRPLHLLFMATLLLYIYFVVRIALQSVYLGHHPIDASCLSVFAAFGMFCIGMVGLYLRRPVIYLQRPHRKPDFEGMPVQIFDPEVFRNTGEIRTDTYYDESDSYRTLNLRDDLYHLMRDEECYLWPGISRYYVASRLQIRRSGLDQVVHLLFNIPYDKYVMVQRVEYCRRYMDKYRNEPSVSVAMACGFPDEEEMHRQWRECQLFFEAADRHQEELKAKQHSHS